MRSIYIYDISSLRVSGTSADYETSTKHKCNTKTLNIYKIGTLNTKQKQ